MPVPISYPKLFNSTEYLQSKVKERQPNGNDFEKAEKMFMEGKNHILHENVAKNIATFSIKPQSDNPKPYSVMIKRRLNLSRDKLSQFSFSCDCPHFKKRSIDFCKHIIYVIRCHYVRD